MCVVSVFFFFLFFFFKQKTAYEMRISDWSSDVCSSDLHGLRQRQVAAVGIGHHQGGAAVPVFRGAVGMDHQRVGVRTLEDGVLAAGEMVGAAGVGEREAVDHGVVVLVLLAGQSIGRAHV